MVQEQQQSVILREGDSFYTIPSDAEGLIEVLNVNNVEVTEDRVVYPIRYYSIDVEQNTHQVALVGRAVLEKVFDIAQQTGKTSKALEREIEELKSRLISMGAMLMAERREGVVKSIENKAYEEMYGKQGNPFQILKELFNNGKTSLYSPGIAPYKFKVMKYKENKEPIDYWMSLFEEWNMIDSSQSNYYKLMVTYQNAKKILKSKIGAIDEK